jgi:hypothetical protein
VRQILEFCGRHIRDLGVDSRAIIEQLALECYAHVADSVGAAQKLAILDARFPFPVRQMRFGVPLQPTLLTISCLREERLLKIPIGQVNVFKPIN